MNLQAVYSFRPWYAFVPHAAPDAYLSVSSKGSQYKVTGQLPNGIALDSGLIEWEAVLALVAEHEYNAAAARFAPLLDLQVRAYASADSAFRQEVEAKWNEFCRLADGILGPVRAQYADATQISTEIDWPVRRGFRLGEQGVALRPNPYEEGYALLRIDKAPDLGHVRESPALTSLWTEVLRQARLVGLVVDYDSVSFGHG